MANLQWFRIRLLELFAKQRECYHNLFQPNSRLLNFWLERDPTIKERALAQKAFQSLVDDSLIYDTNGDKWYTITDEGREALKSGEIIATCQTVEDYLKKYQLHPRIADVAHKGNNSGDKVYI